MDMAVTLAAAARRPTVTSDDAEIVRLLGALVEEVRGLRADMAHNRQQRPSPTLGREDRTRLAAMLPAIAGAYGPEEFTSRDLAEDESPAVRLVVGGLSVKRLSKLFSRADGVPVAGLMVQRQGADLPTVWRVFKTVANPAAAARIGSTESQR
jgi:hypothetical protein